MVMLVKGTEGTDRFGVNERNLEGQMEMDFFEQNGNCCGVYILPKEGRTQGDLLEQRQKHSGRLHCLEMMQPERHCKLPKRD